MAIEELFRTRKEMLGWRFGWQWLWLIAALVAGAVAVIGWLISATMPQASSFLLLFARYLMMAAAVAAVFGLLTLASQFTRFAQYNGEKLDNLTELLTRQNTMLMEIRQGARLSEAAKEILFSEAEQMELGEAALNKLHQHDFEGAEAMIAAIGQHPKYRELASRLKKMAEKYRAATEDGRVNQIIAHIEELMDKYLWPQAAVQIDNLIKTFPYSEKAKQMPKRLQERKDQHKRELLAEWDLAVRNKETDRSLEILKELDLYLTPAEALALKESAATVFRTKLHNLGMEFSVAVTEKNWKKALETGKQIIEKFPNSRMAAEIRSKFDILQERAKQSAS